MESNKNNEKNFRDLFYQLSELAERSRQDSNKVFYELARNLILGATIIIAFSSPIISNQTVLSGVDYIFKTVLFTSWIILFLSIVFGLIQYFIDYKTFQNHYIEIGSFIGKIKEYKEPKEFQDDFRKSMDNFKYITKLWAIKIQVGLLILGLILFIIFITNLIY